MHAQVIATYRSLMTSLATLPHEIAAAQADLTVAKFDLATADKLLAEIEAAQTLNVEGKNAEERKARLAHELSLRSDYRATTSKRAEAQRTVNMLTNDVDNLTRQFAAVGYQTKLHAALMGFLADAMPGQMVDIDFGMANTHTDNGAGITADDAASIGL